MPSPVDVLAYGPLWCAVAVLVVIGLLVWGGLHERAVKHTVDHASDELAAQQAIRAHRNVVALPQERRP